MSVPEVRSHLTIPFILSAEAVAVQDNQNLSLLFLSQVFVSFETTSGLFNHEASLLLPKEEQQAQAASPKKSAPPLLSPPKAAALPFHVRAPSLSSEKKEAGEGKREVIHLPILIHTVKGIIQNMSQEAFSQNQPPALLPPLLPKPLVKPEVVLGGNSSTVVIDVPQGEKGLSVSPQKTLLPIPSPSPQSKESGEIKPPPAGTQKFSQTLAERQLPSDFFTKEFSIQPSKMPLINSHAELTPLFQTPSFQLALPLTFIVPFPFEKTIETLSSGSHKAHFKKERSTKRGEKTKEESAQSMAFIPKGPLLLENGTLIDVEAFAIATTPVTNSQFALWLNERMQLKQIIFNQGEVYDLEGALLGLTQERVSTSQIHTAFHHGELSFTPMRFTEHHPVVHVTWQGAYLFCKENGFCLPEEMQWERAAGMTPERGGEEVKKFIYGCGKDEITSSLANYRTIFASSKPVENRTTPVGFYNGSTLFASHFQTCRTELAISPFGCYDMSGNVEEWTLEKVTKGGSYESPPEDLKIERRKLSDLKKGNAYTGFRVALTTCRP